MVQTRLHKHSLSKKEQAVSGVASRASVRGPIDEFQEVYGSRAASEAFRQQFGSDFSRSGQIQPPIQAKPSFRGLSQELAAESQPVQLREEENKTGLPDDLKAGVENLSGYSLDDVRVHYNSSKPAELKALAYTQGTEIHVGPGQEKHLAHEAWHVVQQMQGRVKPTMQMKGVQINDDDGLEREADEMGRLSLQKKKNDICRCTQLEEKERHSAAQTTNIYDVVTQRVPITEAEFRACMKRQSYIRITNSGLRDLWRDCNNANITRPHGQYLMNLCRNCKGEGLEEIPDRDVVREILHSTYDYTINPGWPRMERDPLGT
jgi:hypothetical protein